MEIVLEVRDDLVNEYELVLEKTMVDAANSFLDTSIVKMKCDAFAERSWYQAKKAKNKYQFKTKEQ